MVQNFERGGDSNREDGIFSDNFGGLNTVASDLNVPYSDSPLLVNCDIDTSGNITKRKGTDCLYARSITATKGYHLLPFTTGRGYTLLFEKFGTTLNVYNVESDTVTLVMTKSNVWDSDAADVRPTVVVTNEFQRRIIYTTGTNQPVQVSILETRTGGGGGNSISNDFANISAAATVVYADGVLDETITSITFNSNILGNSFVLSGGVSATIRDYVFITWQHVVEAIYLCGGRTARAATRSNATQADQLVEIPEEIKWDLLNGDEDFEDPYKFGIEIYDSSDWDYRGLLGTKYSFDTTGQPNTSTEYYFGGGALYDSASDGALIPAPLFAVFGDTKVSGSDRAVFVRRHRLTKYLNGGEYIAGDDLTVLLDGVEVFQNTDWTTASTNYGDFYIFRDDPGAPVGNVCASTATRGYLISWEAAEPIGTPLDSNLEVIHTSTDYIGSAATTDTTEYKDGSCVPYYGLGLFANYRTGSFPRHCAIYENRLVFGGFPGNTFLMVASEILDKTIVGKNFRNFQVDESETAVDSPFDIQLNVESDDYINGMIVWERSLFVFGRKSIHRISFGGDGLFTNTSKTINLLTTNGLVNSRCVVVTDKSILYLSDVGVFDLIQGVDSANFIANEKSLKIRDKFGITRNKSREQLAWMTFDATERKLYLGMPIQEIDYTSHRLYVYSMFRETWTEYDSISGFNIYAAVNYSDRNSKDSLIAACSTYWSSNAPTNLLIIRFGSDTYLDYVKSSTSDGVDTAYELDFNRHFVETVTTDLVQEYQVSVPRTGNIGGFDVIPIKEVKDLYVLLETSAGSSIFTAQVLGTNYVKRPNGSIYFLSNPGGGRKLRVTPRVPSTDSAQTRTLYGLGSAIADHKPVVLYINNVYQVQTQDYTVVQDLGIQEIRFTTAPLSGAVLKYGQPYRVIYTSPTLTLNNFPSLKRTKHAYIYFDNSIGQETFLVSDAANDTIQGAGNIEEIVGQPKYRLNANIAIQYESDYSGEVGYDLYAFNFVHYDDNLFDTSEYPNVSQFRNYSLFKEYLSGIGYSYKLIIWSFEETTFTMSAYQITAMNNAQRYINWV